MDLQYSSTLFPKRYNFRKNYVEYETCVLIFSKYFV